jgi:carbamoyltransferase
MGLAPFGDPDVYAKTVGRMAEVDANGAIGIDLSYFDYQFWGAQRCSPKFFAAFGSPRKGEEFGANHKDVAAAFQMVLEERALDLCAVLRKRSKSRHLIIAGGVALNSVMN